MARSAKMNVRLFTRCCLSLLAGVVLMGSGHAQGNGVPALEMQQGRRVEFPTLPGHAYRIEAGPAGTGWQPVGGVIFGDGSPAVAFLKFSELPAGTAELRVVEIDPAGIGVAPVSLGAGTLTLAEPTASHHYLFLTESSGIVQEQPGRAASFTYSYVKTGAATGRLVALGANFESATMELNFVAADGGTYRRRLVGGDGQAVDDDAGVFSVSPGGVWTEGAAMWSGTANGLNLTVLDGAASIHYAFGMGTVKRQMTGAIPQTLPYSFDWETPSRVTLSLTLSSGLEEVLKLDLKSPGSGLVERRMVKAGGVERVSRGAFSGPIPPALPVSTGFNCPPNSVINLAWDITDSFSGALTMDFDTASVGTKVGRDGGTIEFTPFTYNYTRLDDLHARLVLVYPGLAGDEIEQIDLSFSADDTCSGTFVRKTYRNGVLVATSTGTFGPGQPPPLH
ncbi:MAG: hypothetical protein KA004_16005 [Verrucomicrobiales bacterium]|nr:hypothetical protein [Verrucomicrobiales bacterium]